MHAVLIGRKLRPGSSAIGIDGRRWVNYMSVMRDGTLIRNEDNEAAGESRDAVQAPEAARADVRRLQHILGQVCILEQRFNLLANIIDIDDDLGARGLVGSGERVLVHDPLNDCIEASRADVLQRAVHLERHARDLANGAVAEGQLHVVTAAATATQTAEVTKHTDSGERLWHESGGSCSAFAAQLC